MSAAYLISLATDASDRVPLLRPLIYHEQGRRRGGGGGSFTVVKLK